MVTQETLELMVKAAEKGEDEIRTFLKERGITIDAHHQFDEFKTALIYSIKDNNTVALKNLIKAGADVNRLCDIKDDTNGTPLHFAARLGRVECIQVLVDSGANIEANLRKDGFYYTPFMVASDEQQIGSMEALMKCGADINCVDKDSRVCQLGRAAIRGDDKSVAFLLAAKADAGIKDRFGLTPKERLEYIKNEDDQGRSHVGYSKYIVSSYKLLCAAESSSEKPLEQEQEKPKADKSDSKAPKC